MTHHIPSIVTRTTLDGRVVAVCETCMETSKASFHRPLVEDWKAQHVKDALPPNTKTQNHNQEIRP